MNPAEYYCTLAHRRVLKKHADMNMPPNLLPGNRPAGKESIAVAAAAANTGGAICLQ
jgi:hypothetical protein